MFKEILNPTLEIMFYLERTHRLNAYHIFMFPRGTDVVVIVWWLDLQQPIQSLPITTNVVSSNPAHD
jgi:hypothetical protein